MPRRRTTRASVAQRREAVLSLTQTEIMLVLAAVILLLLLAKDLDLTAARAELAETEQQLAVLTEQTADSPEALVEQRRQTDLAREVKEALARNGARQHDRGRLRLEARDVAAVREMVATRERQQAETAAVDHALARAKPEAGASRKQQMAHLADTAALGATLRESLSEERQRALAGAADPAAQLSSWLRPEKVSEGRGEGIGSGDQVGFDPCWPGPGGAGQRRYYFAYDVTYADGKYRVRRHRDWRTGTAVVAQSLAGRLGAALREHPLEPVSPAALRSFGRRIDAEVDRLRGNAYPPNCLLAVTLNEEASGAVAKFLRGEVRLYPVTR